MMPKGCHPDREPHLPINSWAALRALGSVAGVTLHPPTPCEALLFGWSSGRLPWLVTFISQALKPILKELFVESS